MLIAIEGIDGAGKTTLARLVAKEFQMKVQAFPTKRFKLIKDYLQGKKSFSKENLFLLFLTDISINSTNARNTIFDRYVYSTLAYQNSIFSLKEAETIFQKLNLLKPDYVIFLNLDLKIAMERIKKRKRKVSVFEKKEFLKEVRKNYMEMYENQFYVHNRWIKLDIYDENTNPNKLFEFIKKEIECECSC
ncbi:MAG: dTMP kinase [Candidatus Micrarchaeota archaeon]|nr:dTMP kinase [Candidatus Micrarchaeota archaeon]